MKTNAPIFILYVASQDKSKSFYKAVLLSEPILDLPGMTEFQLTEHAILGIMPEKGIAEILGSEIPHPSLGNGIPRSELYLFVENPDVYYKRAILNGAKMISETKKRSWGHEVAYCADPDGHIIAFAKKQFT